MRRPKAFFRVLTSAVVTRQINRLARTVFWFVMLPTTSHVGTQPARLSRRLSRVDGTGGSRERGLLY